MTTTTETPTNIQINGASVEYWLSATFYSDGLLEVSETADSTVLAQIWLLPEATDQQIHVALEEAFGLAGHFIAGNVDRCK